MKTAGDKKPAIFEKSQHLIFFRQGSKNLETSSELISKPEAINLLDWVSRYLRKSSNFTKSSSSIVAPVLANFNSYFKNTIQTGDLQAIYYNLVGKFKRLEVKHVEYP